MEDIWKDEPQVQLNTSTANVVVVDNVPKTEMSRYEKLYGVIRKIFSAYGSIIDDGLYIPVEGEAGAQKTCGYAFIEYENVEGAQRAVAEGNGKKLDNAHTLLVNYYDDFEKYGKVTTQYTPPAQSDYENKVNLTSWLLDDLGRDQFVVRHGVDTEVFWNDPFRAANDYGRVLKYGGDREKAQDKHWTDLYVAWSPKGSYLSTFHEPGIAIWGGEAFEKLGRFPHGRVQVIEWSPNEKFLLTCNGIEKVNKNDPECFIVWDVRSGKKLRGFDKGTEDLKWPSFKWSHDDKFIARISKDMISVFETPLMGLLDKKSLKIPGVSDFAWSPSDNYISYWVPEQGNGPAKVAVVEIPSRRIVREKHLYSVVDVKMHWHDQGDYLCVKVTRKKTKKTTSTNFEIFRLRQKDVPIEVVEMDSNVVAFAWEPHGNHFAIIHGDGPKYSVSIYSVKKTKVVLHKTYEQRSANTLFWSPLGGHLILAGLGSMNGQLEWIDNDSNEALTSNEHFMCNEVEWDPSGRYCITAVTQPIGDANWRYTMDNGYRLWSLQGQLLAVVGLESCYQVMWRPRPSGLLSKEQVAEIKKTLKEKYWRKFEQEDEEIRQSQLSGAAKERNQLKQAWKTYRAEKEKEYADEREMRRELRGGVPSDDEADYETIEQVVEEEVSREEEIVA